MRQHVYECVNDGMEVRYKDVTICELRLKQVIERRYQVYSNKYAFMYENLNDAVDKYIMLVNAEKRANGKS